jgi:hypothetical protein
MEKIYLRTVFRGHSGDGEKHIGRKVVCGHEECGTKFIAVAQTMQEEAHVADESFEFAQYREESKHTEPATASKSPVSTEAPTNGETENDDVSSNALAKVDLHLEAQSISGWPLFIGQSEIRP